MKKIVIMSGKGGTGKTVVTAGLASLAKNTVFVDCDVDASNLHILLKPEHLKTEGFIGGNQAQIDAALCTGCGRCREVCRYGAIEMQKSAENPPKAVIRSIHCEGCGFCPRVCPEEAIRMVPVESGIWYHSSSSLGPFFHARLHPGEENSGKLVTRVKTAAEEYACAHNADFILADGPPGIGCPAMAALTGNDYLLSVTEPTLSGLHDLKRLFSLAEQFELEQGVVINKNGLNDERTEDIEAECRRRNVPIIAKIPYSDNVLASINAGLPYPRFREDDITRRLEEIAEKVFSR